MLQSMGSQRVGHDLATEQQQQHSLVWPKEDFQMTTQALNLAVFVLNFLAAKRWIVDGSFCSGFSF